MIIIVFGLPGSGKSYFARRLSEKLGAKHLNTDMIRKKPFPVPEYTEEEKMMVYGMLIQAVRAHLKENAIVVLDGTFYKEEIREAFTWTAEKMNDELMYIEVRADEAIIRQRMKENRADSDADYEVYQRVKEEFEPMDARHLVLQSTDTNIREMLDEAIHHLEEQKIQLF